VDPPEGIFVYSTEPMEVFSYEQGDPVCVVEEEEHFFLTTLCFLHECFVGENQFFSKKIDFEMG
jgi:hypothetical protein